jgi:hypothetical protein
MTSADASELVREANGDLVLHPNPRRLRAWFIGSVLAGLPLLFVLVLRGLLELPWWAAALVIAGGVALGAAAFWLRLRAETVRLTPTTLVATTGWGRKRTIRRTSITRIVFATVGTSMRPLAFMLFVGDRGRCLARTPVDGITRESLATFAGQFDLPSTVLGDGALVSFGQLRGEFPGSASWVSAHPVATALVVTPLIVVAVAAFFIGQSLVAATPARLGEARPVYCNTSCASSRSQSEVGTIAVVKVVDPAQATGISAPPVPNGFRLVGVEVRWQGAGSSSMPSTYDPSLDIQILDSTGQLYVPCAPDISASPNVCATMITAGPAFPKGANLGGGSATGYVVFQLPDQARVAKVQYWYEGDELSTHTLDDKLTWSTGQ